jgi:perosamine synthetase
MSCKSVPVNEPLLDGNERRYLHECIDTGWISSEGPFVHRLESEFASRVGRRFGVAVSNGSVALDAAIGALGLGPGDEVIMPSFTIISCASAIIRSGATPVLVDSEPDTWNMDLGQMESKITPRTRAVMAVHIFGLPIDMDALLRVTQPLGIKVIEDAAQMIGQTVRGRPCGSFGHISTFSFYPNKHITTGEGGIIVTDDERLAERCRSLRNLCFMPHKRFVHEELGWNFRMSNLQAALGCAQLERLDLFIAKKQRMGARYADLLSDVTGLQHPQVRTSWAENIYWVYGLVLNQDVQFDADEAIRRLEAKGVGCRPFFWPMHKQPVFRRMGLFAGESFPVSERLAQRGFYIPSGLALTTDQALHVANSVREMFSQ